MAENKIFKEPKTFFQEKINSIVKTEREAELVKPLIQQAFYQEQLKTSPSNLSKLIELYNFLGLDNFADFLAIFEGESFKLPKLDSFKKAVELAVTDTYQKEKHLNPEETDKFVKTNSFHITRKMLEVLNKERKING